jgi:hypothetical protein
MASKVITLAVEGPVDVPVARRLLATVGLEAGPVYGKGGKTSLDQKLHGFNRAAAFSPWLVLRDLDHDEPCPGVLVARLLPRASARMCFRIAVRETEAWLLADRDQIAAYLSVPVSLVPGDPEQLDDPKQALVNLARKSRRRILREDLVPLEGSTAKIGPGYLARVSEYVGGPWRPEVAARTSQSLARCLAALQRLKQTK